MDKLNCLEFNCMKPIGSAKLKQYLSDELFEKYERFKAARLIEGDPMIRFCPKPSCGAAIRAENEEATRLVCSECGTEVCFKCRDYWHGETVSCEQAMNKQLEGWAEENQGNISFCPMCRTRIEKNKGCNHMTCAFCKYEFCWACGASATTAERHFEPGRGCGVKMMDENVKPGDHLNLEPYKPPCGGHCSPRVLSVLKFIGLFLIFPLWALWNVNYNM